MESLALLTKFQLKKLLKESGNHWSRVNDFVYLDEYPSLAHLRSVSYKGCVQPYLCWMLRRDERRWLLKLRLGQVGWRVAVKLGTEMNKGSALYQCIYCLVKTRFPLLHLVLACSAWLTVRRQYLQPAFRSLLPLPSGLTEIESRILACDDMFLCNRMGLFLSKILSCENPGTNLFVPVSAVD